MKYFDDDINWIFTFCKNCWEFKKFIFDAPINFENRSAQIGICFSCKQKQLIPINQSKEYYENLNRYNN